MSKTAITLKDVYDIVNRLEEKYDNQYNLLEGRTRQLENFQNRAMGILGVIALFSGAITNFIFGKLTGK